MDLPFDLEFAFSYRIFYLPKLDANYVGRLQEKNTTDVGVSHFLSFLGAAVLESSTFSINFMLSKL